MQITYQKRDGSIIQKLRSTEPPYEVGETTSMGWKLLSIKYEYKGEFYPQYELQLLINKDRDKLAKKTKIKSFFKNKIKIYSYYVAIVIILYYIKIRLGI